MLEYSFGFRKVHRLIWLVLTIFVLWGYSLQNVAGSVYYPLSLQPNTTVTTPPVILQAGTAGTSTIYTNNTSALVNVAAPASTCDFVDNNTSDVDLGVNKGTHSNFTAQQYGPDSTYDTLTEEDTSIAGKYNSHPTAHTITGVAVNNPVNAYDSNNATYADFEYDADGGFQVVSFTTDTGTISQVDFKMRCEVQAASNDMYRLVYYVDPSATATVLWDWSSVARSLDTYVWSNQPEPNDASWSWTDISNIRFCFETDKVLGPDNAKIYEYGAWVTVTKAVDPNYELDLEVQWTAVDYDETNEELCIYGGTMGAENIRVDVWNGSNWENLFTDLSSGWNNISVSSYLTSSTFTIRFKGGTETGDTTQDSWNIDATLLHVWTDQSYDYVLKVNNTVAENWEIRLKAYDQSNIGRLQNCTIYFHNGGGNSCQIYILNGAYDRQVGDWYGLAASSSDYIAITLSATSTGTSYVYVYLEILLATSTYSQYVITFEIT